MASQALREWSPPVSPTPRYPRGNPLTESMPFTDRDGGHWLVYIEGVLEPRLYRRHRATLPARRLRFDSAGESRVTAELPAGSPFLPDARLQDLLDQAQPVPPFLPFGWQPLELSDHAHRAIEWAARARTVGRAVLADWTRRWRERAGQRQVLRERTCRFLSRSLETALTSVARIAAGRRRSTVGRRWRDGDFARVEDRQNVGVLEPGSQADLAEKALAAQAGGDLRVEYLERH